MFIINAISVVTRWMHLNFLSKHTGKYLGLSNESEDPVTSKEEDDPNDEKETNPEVGSIVTLVSEAST